MCYLLRRLSLKHTTRITPKTNLILQCPLFYTAAKFLNSSTTRWFGLGKAWPEYKHLLDYKPTLPAKPPQTSANFASNTSPNLSADWMVACSRGRGKGKNSSNYSTFLRIL